jgi:preprotein translocase subunit SecE
LITTVDLQGGFSLLDQIRPAQIKEFLNNVKLEMRKVSWPGRKEVYGTTVVVIGAVFFFGIYLGLVDLVLHFSVAKIFNFFK